MGSAHVMAVGVTATVCAITGVRAAPTLGQPIWNTLADNACSYHINSLAPAVALQAPRHDRRRTGAAGSPPGGFPLCAEHDRELGGGSPLSSLMVAKD